MGNPCWNRHMKNDAKPQNYIAFMCRFSAKQTAFMMCLLFAVLQVFMSVSSSHAGHASGLFVSPQHAADRFGDDPEMLFVDIRSQSDFESIRIPGSINIPLHFIKARDHLKQRTIVLVDRGFSTSHMVRACRHLNQMDFEARILSGGLNAWTQNELPVAGNPFEARALSMVSPADVYPETSTGRFLPVDVSGSFRAKPESDDLFEDILLLDATEADFANHIARYRIDHPRRAILFFNQDGSGYETIRRQVQSAGIRNAFFLEGGLDALNRHVSNQRRAGGKKSRRTISVNRISCISCND